MIELRQVRHAFGDRCVLDGITQSLSERRIGVVGGNGSGKSTFARLLNGLIIPAEGEVLVDGLNTRVDGKAVRRKVGFVFQNPDNQIVLPVVEEDIAFGMKNLGFSLEEIKGKTTEVLERFGLAEHRNHPSHLLSGGQKQLLALAGVLVMKPERIVFDEPTTLLDLRNQRRFARVIEELAQPVIVVSHDLELIRGFDRILAFEDGRIVIDDAPSAALARYVARME